VLFFGLLLHCSPPPGIFSAEALGLGANVQNFTSTKRVLLLGAVGIFHDTSPVPGFEAYIANLTVADNLPVYGNSRNPWFLEYLSKKTGCTTSGQ